MTVVSVSNTLWMEVGVLQQWAPLKSVGAMGMTAMACLAIRGVENKTGVTGGRGSR
jgi:hypothetical protein